MTKVIILGASGFAREVLQLLKDLNAKRPDYTPVGFVDENTEKHGTTLHGLPVLGGFDVLASTDRSIRLAMGVALPTVKKKFASLVGNLGGYAFETLIHPSVTVGANLAAGRGLVIAAGAVVSVDITLGDYATVNWACTVGHDVVLGEYATLHPHCAVGGWTAIGEGAELGSASTTIPSTRIGAWSVIGAGAVVTRDIPDRVVAVGCPARATRPL